MTDEPGRLPDGAFLGREAFRASVSAAFLMAERAGWREMIISDADFEDWPLNERALVDALGKWIRQADRFVMLARNYDKVVRLHPLFTEWRRFWSHKIDCRICSHAGPQDMPSALWSPEWALARADTMRSTGTSGSEPERRVAQRQALDEWLKRSTPGFPATTLGL
ncbi:hypothetical protein FVQ98_01005 [Ottowia sp. GY511]|uniref:Uncharacterized protein n=2 Tax=Ottowia TaxID=219181 RepID=A0ABW4KVY0_9BURK|nr:hypothetical protein FVQ98_01005 [Ottowia sp. GY511]